ncbi:SGNH/GDSL hydrolase family protein [Mesorhizobium sp. YC-39]|uniref:SGNH/GDSL hydrolase family protein n=1 Tax=unclassified Mesorhizobium TaxID=325217 RepID=UPI0021E88B4D|nr:MULTISPECIES: SGNH/GDSL hydrolase family protein [unclassified Mesorhizobium]MCV3211528.1 SGNH/GDSL hydrolase family protein [Mesorhizobium sp. YC-2]MCV3233274.1 SGNH/GDSL hydrolase family protein [Mesorhizobium sp. YC-39]
MTSNDLQPRRSTAIKRVIYVITLTAKMWLNFSFALLLIALMEVSLTSYYKVSDEAKSEHAVKAAAYSGVYEDPVLAEEYLKERVDAVDWPLPLAPYTQSLEPDYTGKFLNVHDGIRRTWNGGPSNDDESTQINIFFFGGSTLWGWGSRDDFTIPSLVAKNLVKSGISAKVTNYAVNGDATTQSLIRFIFELKKRNVPDLVIFYGGLIDAESTCSEDRPGLPLDGPDFERMSRENEARVSIKPENIAIMRFLAGRKRHGGCQKNLDTLSDGAADVYFENIRFIETISGSLLFKTLFYLEPQLNDKEKITIYEQKAIERHDGWLPGASSLYSLMRNKVVARDHDRADQNVLHDLRSIFSGVSSPIYMDSEHYGEDGNNRIAHKISADILALYASGK